LDENAIIILVKNLKNKHILIALTILLFFILGVFQFVRKQDKQIYVVNQNPVRTWDPGTSSFKVYSSYDEMEKELESKKQVELEKYNEVIKGTIIEKVQNIFIPSYEDEKELKQLRQGEIVVRGEKSDDFPDGVFLWSASLDKNVNSFTVGDFNKDGLEDVAHIVGYTGGGSGYFYNLSIFINNKGKLKYLTQIELGDRTFIKSVKYSSGYFVVDIITQGEGDDFKGYCCPNIPKTIIFQLKNNKLVEI